MRAFPPTCSAHRDADGPSFSFFSPSLRAGQQCLKFTLSPGSGEITCRYFSPSPEPPSLTIFFSFPIGARIARSRPPFHSLLPGRTETLIDEHLAFGSFFCSPLTWRKERGRDAIAIFPFFFR